jgi:hypothetical protein
MRPSWQAVAFTPVFGVLVIGLIDHHAEVLIPHGACEEVLARDNRGKTILLQRRRVVAAPVSRIFAGERTESRIGSDDDGRCVVICGETVRERH